MPQNTPEHVMERIRRRLSECTPAERSVARLLLAGPLSEAMTSSARLADRAGVSGPTVSRFVARLGYDGYAEFQDALRADVAAREVGTAEIYQQHVSSGHPANPGSPVAQSISTAVHETLTRVDSAELRSAVELLADVRRPIVSNGGSISHITATYLATSLRMLRTGVQDCPPTAPARAASIADLKKRSVVVLFDYRLYETAVTEFAQAARDRGAKVIMVTDPYLSPVAEFADVVLTAAVDADTPFEVLSPTFAVVELLLSGVASALGASAAERVESVSRMTGQWL